MGLYLHNGDNFLIKVYFIILGTFFLEIITQIYKQLIEFLNIPYYLNESENLKSSWFDEKSVPKVIRKIIQNENLFGI